MAVRPEVLAQIARMLGDDALRSASDDEVQAAAERNFDTLVDSLVAEIADSDDVFDRSSALDYVDHRLKALAQVLAPALTERLRTTLVQRVEGW